MVYIVLETQTSNGATAIVPPVTFDNRQQAESRWHAQAQLAAISSVEEHAVMLLTSTGQIVRNDVYLHPKEPENTEE